MDRAGSKMPGRGWWQLGRQPSRAAPSRAHQEEDQGWRRCQRSPTGRSHLWGGADREANLGVSESALHCRLSPYPSLPQTGEFWKTWVVTVAIVFHSHLEHHSQDAQKVNITVKTGHWAVLSRLSAQPLCSHLKPAHPHSMVQGTEGKRGLGPSGFRKRWLP